jgi:hypothetical protein
MNLAPITIIRQRFLPLLLPIVMGASGCAPKPQVEGSCQVKSFQNLGGERITASTTAGLRNICSKMFIFSSFRNEPRILQIGTDTIEIPPSTLDVRS